MRKIILFGIPNCDTVKKARVWLSDQNVEHTFHDFKKQGLDRATVEGWLRHASRDVLINRKGTTWRALPDDVKASVTGDEAAIAVMLANPSVIKRPVLVHDGLVIVGFDVDAYAALVRA